MSALRGGGAAAGAAAAAGAPAPEAAAGHALGQPTAARSPPVRVLVRKPRAPNGAKYTLDFYITTWLVEREFDDCPFPTKGELERLHHDAQITAEEVRRLRPCRAEF